MPPTHAHAFDEPVFTGGTGGLTTGFLATSLCPQWLQNIELSVCLLQLGQTGLFAGFLTIVPHSVQNLALDVRLAPQLSQVLIHCLLMRNSVQPDNIRRLLL
jgi:hypothetical protein